MAHVAREMERARLQAAAADRRRHHLARAHRGEDRAELLRARWSTCPTPRAACRRVQSLLSREQREAYLREVRADYEKIRAQHRDKKGPGPLHHARARARANGHKIDWARYVPPAPAKPGLTALQRLPARRSWSTTSTGRPFFQAWELSGPVSRRSSRTRWSARPRARCSREGAGDARAHRARAAGSRANGVFGLCPAAQVDGDDIEIYADETRDAACS